MRTSVVIALIVAGFGCSAAAFEPGVQAGSAGAVQLNIPLSLRAQGMGGVAVGGHDVLTSWSNPAALSGLKTRGELAIQGGPQFVNQTSLGLGGAWRLTPAWVIGGTLGTYILSMNEVDVFGGTGDTIGQQVLGVALSGAWQHEWFAAGLSLRTNREVMLDTSSLGTAADLGVTGTWGALVGAVSLRNLGTPLLAPDAKDLPAGTAVWTEQSPAEIRAGAAYTVAPWHLTGAAELNMTTAAATNKAGVGVGAEWWPGAAIGIRAGGGTFGGGLLISAGISGIYKLMTLDYAFTYQDAGAGNRLSLSYGWGEKPEGSPVADSSEPPVRKEEVVISPPVTSKPGVTRLNVAIADLRAENVSAGDAAVMADLLRNELVKTMTFNVIEKQNMDKVLAEHAFQQTGCTNEECAVKLGKLLNVQRMAVGSFGKLLDSYFLNIRVVNIETGQVNFADSAEGATVKDLKVAVRDMARRMASQIK